MNKKNDTGYRGVEYKTVKGHKVSETEFEASYEFASGNETSKKSKQNNTNNKN
ncbi:hypothetical protein [Alteribacillus sp. YIM 98480]|uniref:hypothetical protein n=1 Tax=Alteribacillus sp. YIM 98480 TaxID=2606599 RepID=UPI00131D0296|nr:hypothetical protein [Alteribacillus sp. YIM 98480]